MAAGLQVFDANGNIIVDTTTSTFRILGSVVITAANQSGSLTNTGFSSGTPSHYSSPTSSGAGWNEGALPRVTFSGNTMTWSMAQPYLATQTYTFTGTIYYGVS